MTTTPSGFDVLDYVQVVRLYLGDLDDQVREELTDGLAADLDDLVADKGTEVLPDPEQYADELRAAAALPARNRSPHFRDSSHAGNVLDAAREQLRRAIDPRATRTAWSYLLELRPVWWCLRAQVAFWTWQTIVGQVLTLRPWATTSGLLLWSVLTVLSIGLGRLARSGPGVPVRLWLLAVNSSAVLGLAYFYHQLDSLALLR